MFSNLKKLIYRDGAESVKQYDTRADYSISHQIDASDSMNGENGSKIKRAREAGIDFIQNMDFERMEMGLISFGGHVRALCGLTRDPRALKRAVRGLKASGGTPFLEAMELGYREHLKDTPAKPVLLIVTDGRPTDASPEEILSYGDRLKEEGIRIITIGIGGDVNEKLLRKLASRPEDSFFGEPPQLTDFYGEIVEGILAEIPESK